MFGAILGAVSGLAGGLLQGKQAKGAAATQMAFQKESA